MIDVIDPSAVAPPEVFESDLTDELGPDVTVKERAIDRTARSGETDDTSVSSV